MKPEFQVKPELLEEEKDEQGILEDLKNRMKIDEIAEKWDKTEEEIIKIQTRIKGGDINASN